jgi:hypothetical protein
MEHLANALFIFFLLAVLQILLMAATMRGEEICKR